MLFTRISSDCRRRFSSSGEKTLITYLIFIKQPGAGPTRCLDAFLVALGRDDSSGWFSSTLELQLTSLRFCELCRSVPALHLTVGTAMHDLVWTDSPSSDLEVKERYDTRVPTLRPLILTWRLPRFCLNGFSRKAFATLQQLKFGDHFNEEMNDIVWLSSLQQLTFGGRFKQPLDRVAWPPSLQQLTFGSLFNQPIDRVAWPPSLQQLTFGGCFNQPIDRVAWPPTLQQLTFGYLFDQPIDRIAWPPSLQQLNSECVLTSRSTVSRGHHHYSSLRSKGL